MRKRIFCTCILTLHVAWMNAKDTLIEHKFLQRIKNEMNATDVYLYLAARVEMGWTWWIPSLVPGYETADSAQAQTESWVLVLVLEWIVSSPKKEFQMKKRPLALRLAAKQDAISHSLLAIPTSSKSAAGSGNKWLGSKHCKRISGWHRLRNTSTILKRNVKSRKQQWKKKVHREICDKPADKKSGENACRQASLRARSTYIWEFKIVANAKKAKTRKFASKYTLGAQEKEESPTQPQYS